MEIDGISRLNGPDPSSAVPIAGRNGKPRAESPVEPRRIHDTIEISDEGRFRAALRIARESADIRPERMKAAWTKLDQEDYQTRDVSDALARFLLSHSLV